MAREMNNYTPNVQQVAGQTAAGKPVALLVEDDGTLKTSGGGGGGGGDATAANQALQIAEAEDTNTELATLNGKIPAVGQKSMAASIPVVLPSDQSAIPVTVPGVSTSANQATQITEAQTTNSHLSLITGSPGSDFVADTSAHTDAYGALVAITDAVIDTITLASGSSGAAALAGKTIFAGQVIMVPFTSITLTSGTAQLVKLPA